MSDKNSKDRPDDFNSLLEFLGGEEITLDPKEQSSLNVLLNTGKGERTVALHEVVYSRAAASLPVFDILWEHTDKSAIGTIGRAYGNAVKQGLDQPTEYMRLDTLREYYASKLLNFSSSLDDRYMLNILETLLTEYYRE